ncbi:MerR family transcriptional regulator [Streptomyces sp. NPDC093225]|uniref:MerR family transcriptional regulator n=1 Tax=Streptomyces sp. NPDC093225 TaxID=3366034 RepID=UPI0037F311AA
MRIGELSRNTGVPIPTIKFYVREGLVPAGELTSPNQARYDDSHVRRLRLIRALMDVGGLSVAAIRGVLAAVEDTEEPVHGVLGEAARTVAPAYRECPDEDRMDEARALVLDLVARRGWRVPPDHRGIEPLATALAHFLAVGHGDYLGFLDEFAAASERIAAADLAYVARREAREDLVERVVVGTVLGDAVLAAMRRIAQVDASARRYPTGSTDGGA